MVCLGNICRSPLAEGILKHKVAQNGLNWHIESAGTYGGHADEKPDKRSQKIAKKNGIDITDQRSRQVRTFDFEEFDIIYAMDKSNFNNLRVMAENEEEKTKVKMIMNEISEDDIDVPDPYYGEYGFENVFDMLDKACNVIIEKYK